MLDFPQTSPNCAGGLFKRAYADFEYRAAGALSGKTALITGCNRGIGKAIVEEFAKNGATILAHARCETPEFVAFLENLSAQYHVKITPLYFDLADFAAIKNAVKTLRQSGVDILVNNAGITLNKLFLMTTESEVAAQMNVNFNAVFVFSQYVAKLMQRQKRGVIINISSTSALGGDCGRSAYGAAKAAVSSLTKTMAEELGESGIRVNAIAPGFIQTDMMNAISADFVARNLELSKLKRMGEPQEVARVALFLASEAASYVTGQVVHVDGGLK